MSDVPGGRPLDVFRELGNTVQAAGRLASPFLERRRKIAFTDAVTKARRESNNFRNELIKNPDWESYDVEWSRKSDEIASSIADTLNDPVVQEQFYHWWSSESETARQKVEQMAWSRETAAGITTMETGLEASTEMTDYDERREQVRFVTEAAYQSGYIDKVQREQIRNKEYEQIFMDQAHNTLDEIFSDGGYDASLNWINSNNGTNEAQRAELITRLNRLDAQAQRRFRQRQQESINTLYEGIYSGETTMRSILEDPYIDANQQDWLIRKLQQLAEAERTNGEGETTEEGRNTIARLQTDLDRGRDWIEVMDEADQAYIAGELSRTEWQSLRGYKPLEEFAPWWDQLESTIEELELPVASTMADARRRLQGLLFVKTGENTWARNTSVSEKEIQQYFENLERELAGEQVMKRAFSTDYSRGEANNIFGRINRGEENLLAIDQGQLLGFRNEEPYVEWLNEMSFEHKRMFENVPFAENVSWAGFDRDGRPVFTATTPVGQRAIAWFMIDPNTREEFQDEQPYYWDKDRRRWEVLPQTEIPTYGGSGGGTGSSMQSSTVQGISAP